MKKYIYIITVTVVVLLTAFFTVKWFAAEKYDIEHVEHFGFPGEYTYTRQTQIENVLQNNKKTIETLVLNMRKYPETHAIVLSGLDEYIKEGNNFVIDNELLLSEFYMNSKMDYILFYKKDNICEIRQETPAGKTVSWKIIGKIDENDKFQWEIYNNTSSDRYFSLKLYNLIYN